MRPPYRNVPADRGGDVILGAGATPLLGAAKAGDLASIQLLLAHHAAVDLANYYGVTPLMAAAGMGQSENPTRGRYKTPEEGAKSVLLLLEAGADINKQAHKITVTNDAVDPKARRRFNSFEGQAAIHGAAMKGWTPVIQVLADHGANLELVDADGHTPLDYAEGKYTPALQYGKPDPFPEAVTLLKKLLSDKVAEKL